jgi:hypothetical protein
MDSSSLDDPVKLWLDHAERGLYVLATELRRIPLDAVTRRLHLRALELKRNVARWREHPPSRETAASTLEEVEALAREAQLHSPLADRSRSGALAAVARLRGRPHTLDELAVTRKNDRVATQRPLSSRV